MKIAHNKKSPLSLLLLSVYSYGLILYMCCINPLNAGAIEVYSGVLITKNEYVSIII